MFFAAEEAVWLDERLGKLVEEAGFPKPSVRPTEVSSMERAKQLYPRAYTSWTAQEDAELSAMHARGLSKNELGEHFQRQPSAIQSRLRKLGLIKD